MKNSEKLSWMIVGALLAGMAGEWFLSGTHEMHSTTRNLFVVIQGLIGIGLFLYPYWKGKARSS